MPAHRSFESFKQGHEVGDGAGGHHGRNAALVVAVIAAFLAIATFLSNEAVKHVITEETHRADTSAQLESNRVKIDVAEGDETMLRVLATGRPQERLAGAAAERHEARVARELRPTDARLEQQIRSHEHDTAHANTQHIEFELSEVGLEVGIVLASVSILASRRWLLGAAGAIATAGVVLLLVGLLFA
jgi:hypothetical protein